MRLYLVRHAIAAPHGAPGIADDERPLTDAGIKKMKQAARGFRELGVLPEIILSSPLPRARQTAEILVETLGKKVAFNLTDALSPSGSRQGVYEEIEKQGDPESIMLIGHQPSLGEIAGEIAWGSPEYYLELKKGGACCLDEVTMHPNPRGTLLWVLTPSILRELA
jgi:phosphohistidine phosphatase